MAKPAYEITVSQAIDDSINNADILLALAKKHRKQHTEIDQANITRHWEADAKTYCYQTHIAISNQNQDKLNMLANTLFNASKMQSQPWYDQFIGGSSQSIENTAPSGVDAHQITVGSFDVGLSKPRCYRQLLSLLSPEKNNAVIVARSVNTGPSLPNDAILAYTLAPNGEVLYWENNILHWHHICCTPGASILPSMLDRWLINSLRVLRLDSAERKTYRDEANNMRRWLQSS